MAFAKLACALVLSIPWVEAATTRPRILNSLRVNGYSSWESHEVLAHKYLQALKVSLTGTLLKTASVQPGLGSVSTLTEQAYNESDRVGGKDWPKYGLTMVGEQRLDNIYDLLKRAIQDGVPGDFVECGVWRGGASMYAKAVIDSYEPRSRRVHLVDSFEGLPKSTTSGFDSDHWSRIEYLRVSKEDIAASFQKLNLLDSDVAFHKGFFRYSAPQLRTQLMAEEKRIVLLRMDGDMYESTIDILYNLYDLVSVGGCVIVDDWIIPECRRAIDDFRVRHKVFDEVVAIDEYSAYWCKSHALDVDYEWYRNFNESRTAE